MFETSQITELHTLMVEQARKVAAGESAPSVANAIATTTAVILRHAKLAMEYSAMPAGQRPQIPFLADSLPAEDGDR